MRSTWHNAIAITTVLLLAACPRGGDPEPDAAPPSDAAPAPISCLDCEFGWTCDLELGRRCWAGTQERCEPHPNDPPCEP